ncbi:hypothetical protein PBI_KALPINE_90 [Mycobacterium phage Kalpine]|nr:hypothetical protein PBI_KALPINE_90 [Mycobacterium phage Kalpine]
MSDYAWIIDKDHLYEPGGICGDEAGVIGPHDANLSEGSDDPKAELTRNYQRHNQFRMYDDDGELYYTGTLFWNGDEPEEEFVYGPLGDFGMPNAGCTDIRYTGHREWDCG